MLNLLDSQVYIAVDVAGGLSRDNSAIEIIDPVTLQSVASFRSNTIDNPNLTMLLVELVTKYFPTSVLVIERNSYGLGIIQNIMYSPIAGNLYYEKRQKIAEKRVADVRNKSPRSVETRVYGVNTDKDSRKKMIEEILYDTVSNEPSSITSKYVYENIKTLERKKNNKVEHRSGEHDDNLFAYLVARYILSYGTNLNKFKLHVKSEEEAKKIQSNVNNNFMLLSRANKFDNSPKGSLYDEMIQKNVEFTNAQKSNTKTSNRSRQISNILSMNRNN